MLRPSKLALLLAFSAVAGPAGAMQWHATDRGLATVIEAIGDIEPGDADRLRELVAAVNENVKDLVQRAEAFDYRPAVEFHSPGGNLVAGLQLGFAINELGLHTRVPEGNICFSACTYAFLGGADRRVIGPFGVHAVSSASGHVEAGMLDEVQEISALLVAYAREMVGVSDMAEAGLKVRAADIYQLTDNELRDWNVITHVSRPGQHFSRSVGPLSRCDDDDWRQEMIPHDIICSDLTVARDYIEIGEAVAAVRDHVDAAALDAEQARFEAYWQGCETAWMGELQAPQQIRPRVEACMRAAFSARAAELAALRKFHEVGLSEPAKSGWKAAD